MSKIKIGVSSCLLGEKVRWNSGHCFTKFINQMKDDYDFISVCPEVGIGLGIPRPTIRLVQDIEDIANNLLVSSKTGEDLTNIMEQYSIEKIKQLKQLKINGFLLKSRSPTCGLRVKVYQDFKKNNSSSNSMGKFAQMIERLWPELPTTEEGRLNDTVLNEKFNISTECHHDWNTNVDKNNINTLIDFHQRHKYLLHSFNLDTKKELGRLLANQKHIHNVFDLYYTKFFLTLKHSSLTIHNICNAYTNMFDKLMKRSNHINNQDKKEFYYYIKLVREQKIQKIVPKILLKHYIRKSSNLYLNNQKNLSL